MPSYLDKYVPDIARLAALGFKPKSIANQLGLSHRSTVRQVALRHGIEITSEPVQARSLRELVLDMPPLEAIEHLLYIIEELTGTPEELHKTYKETGFTRASARLYYYMRKTPNIVCTLDQLQAALSNKPGEKVSVEVLRVYIHKIRKRLPAHETIESVSGTGYKLCVHQPEPPREPLEKDLRHDRICDT